MAKKCPSTTTVLPTLHMLTYMVCGLYQESMRPSTSVSETDSRLEEYLMNRLT